MCQALWLALGITMIFFSPSAYSLVDREMLNNDTNEF